MLVFNFPLIMFSKSFYFEWFTNKCWTLITKWENDLWIWTTMDKHKQNTMKHHLTHNSRFFLVVRFPSYESSLVASWFWKLIILNKRGNDLSNFNYNIPKLSTTIVFEVTLVDKIAKLLGIRAHLQNSLVKFEVISSYCKCYILKVD